MAKLYAQVLSSLKLFATKSGGGKGATDLQKIKENVRPTKRKVFIIHAMRSLLMAILLTTLNAAYSQDISNITHQTPFLLQGDVELTAINYAASGIAYRRQPFNYLLAGTPVVSIYGLVIPFSFAISQQDESFRQPFNEFGISPTYKWLTLHLGYQNLTYSPYTLGGHTILGVGFDIHPGKLRAGFMYGRLNKATKIDTTSQAIVPYAFSRKAIAARLGYGTDNNFFELNYLSAKDDSTSVSKALITPANYIPPAANTVVGYTTKFTFFKKLFFESTGAVSLYTRDLNSPVSVDSFKNSELTELQKFFKVNGTSELFSAVNADMGYRAKHYTLKLEYVRIDPDYQSMGTYFFNPDVEDWTFTPSFDLFNNRIRFNGSVGYEHDNINHQKEITNKRLIGAASLGIDITKSLAVDASYSNFSNNQQSGTVRFPDSLRVVETTSVISVTPRYTIIGQSLVQVISFSVMLNKLSDFNQVVVSNQLVSREIDTKQYFLNYIINLTKKSIGFFGNLSRTELSGASLNSVYQGVTVGGFMSFAKSKLQANINTSVMQGSGTSGSSLVVNSTGSLSYKINKHQAIKTTLFITNTKPVASQNQGNYSEFRNELTYKILF